MKKIETKHTIRNEKNENGNYSTVYKTNKLKRQTEKNEINHLMSLACAPKKRE